MDGEAKGSAGFSQADEMNPAWLAMSRFRRRKFDDAIDLCSQCLSENGRDQAMWFLKVTPCHNMACFIFLSCSYAIMLSLLCYMCVSNLFQIPNNPL